MKRLFLVSLCWLSCSFGTVPEWVTPVADLDKMQVKGTVQFISQRVYELSKRGNALKKRHLMLDPLANWDLEFNKKGFIVEKKCYDAANKVLFYYEYKYKKQSQLQRRNMYDTKGYRIEQLAYAYNALGQVAAESTYRSDNSLLVRYVHTYALKGQLVQTDVHAPANVYTTSKYEFVYNKEGQLIEQHTYNQKDQRHQTDAYSYDENGFPKAHTMTNHLDKFDFVSYTQHDDQGNVITFQAPTEKEPLTSYTYTFDEIGNWTRKVHYKEGKAINMVERVFVYE
jgi:hypothetical protein